MGFFIVSFYLLLFIIYFSFFILHPVTGKATGRQHQKLKKAWILQVKLLAKFAHPEYATEAARRLSFSVDGRYKDHKGVLPITKFVEAGLFLPPVWS